MKEVEVLSTTAPDVSDMVLSSTIDSFTAVIALLSLVSMYVVLVYSCKRIRRQRMKDSSRFCVLDSILLGRARVYYLQTPAGPALALISSHGVTLTYCGAMAEEEPDRQIVSTGEQRLFRECLNE